MNVIQKPVAKSQIVVARVFVATVGVNVLHV
jgi:hypothetical protein